MQQNFKQRLEPVSKSQENATPDLNTLFETFEDLLRSISECRGESFQRLFVQLIVFVSIDLEGAIATKKSESASQYVRSLAQGLGAVSRRFVSGDLQDVQIKAKLLPIFFDALATLRGDTLSQDALEKQCSQWQLLGIEVGTSAPDLRGDFGK